MMKTLIVSEHAEMVIRDCRSLLWCTKCGLIVGVVERSPDVRTECVTCFEKAKVAVDPDLRVCTTCGIVVHIEELPQGGSVCEKCRLQAARV